MRRSPPRPIGRPQTPPAASNRASGWEGYRLLRNLSVPRLEPRRHGNWKHGRRSQEWAETGRTTRALIRILRGGPLPGAKRAPKGWRGFRAQQS
ncbi:hypothetical protein [Roseomonas xinghualingensis]|uniref:hypothetical protein n=1 Tax=Roseomonas xinghualingensis TaxID=2986475 RepID=UPI0021F21B8F|nr:hypothetical protein [Roseomonas sp. SXEYE001]MCV4209863.1 hypothetical protein [Roseomonas sp. SXEYE001]